MCAPPRLAQQDLKKRRFDPGALQPRSSAWRQGPFTMIFMFIHDDVVRRSEENFLVPLIDRAARAIGDFRDSTRFRAIGGGFVYIAARGLCMYKKTGGTASSSANSHRKTTGWFHNDAQGTAGSEGGQPANAKRRWGEQARFSGLISFPASRPPGTVGGMKLHCQRSFS